MNESKHTPISWMYSRNWNKISDKFVNVVAGMEGENQEANAEFIVQACNCHDDMTSVMEWVHTVLGEYLLANSQEERDYIRGDMEHAHNKLSEALAKAKG